MTRGKLEGKIAIVTGGASGIGKAIATRFTLEGAKVIIADIQEEAGTRLAENLKDSLFLKVDVSVPREVETMVKSVVDRYSKLDIMVNNAGIGGEQAPTVLSSVATWRKVIAVNLDGVYFGMKYGIAAMLSGGNGGVVLNMGSIAGMVAFGNNPAYSASKAGVIQLSKAAAIEYASDRIRVNAICPTAIDTPMLQKYMTKSKQGDLFRKAVQKINPIPGMPTTEDVANAALFLASDEAKFITGLAFPVDGGYTAR